MREILFLCWSAFFTFFEVGVLAQTHINGQATVNFQNGETSCNDNAAVVDVFVDVTGLFGDGGAVGVNAFVLVLDLNRTGVFASALRGGNPSLDWHFATTEKFIVDATNRLILVGSVGDDNAPNGEYQVARLFFSGIAGPVVVTLNEALSSLGSRVVMGDGPGEILIMPASPLAFSIPANFELDLFVAMPFWLQALPAYDFIDPEDVLNVLDFAQLINCGG